MKDKDKGKRIGVWKFATFFFRINDIEETTRDPVPLPHLKTRPGVCRLMHSFCRLQELSTRPATHSPCDFNDSRPTPPELRCDPRPIPPGGRWHPRVKPLVKSRPATYSPCDLRPIPPDARPHPRPIPPVGEAGEARPAQHCRHVANRHSIRLLMMAGWALVGRRCSGGLLPSVQLRSH